MAAAIDKQQKKYYRRRFTDKGLRQMGSFLRSWRERRGLTVQELSEQTKRYEAQFFIEKEQTPPKVMGVSIAGISRIENGYYSKPAPDMLWLLLDVLEPVHPTKGHLLGLEELLLIGTEFWSPDVESDG